MNLLKIHNTIENEISLGRSREEIFHNLTEKFPLESGKFAYCLASIPSHQMRRRYLKLNGILFILLLILSWLSLAVEFPIDLQESTLFIVIKVLVPLIFSYFVYRFHGGVYRLLGIWCLLDLAEALLLLKFTTALDLTRVLTLIPVVCLAFLIARKAFPNLRILGPKQDKQGRYLL